MSTELSAPAEPKKQPGRPKGSFKKDKSEYKPIGRPKGSFKKAHSECGPIGRPRTKTPEDRKKYLSEYYLAHKQQSD